MSGLHTIFLGARDLDRSTAFYSGLLGRIASLLEERGHRVIRRSCDGIHDLQHTRDWSAAALTNET